MSKSNLTISLDSSELEYLNKITSELKLENIEQTIGRLIKDTGKDWFDELNQNKFKEKITNIPIDELADVISSIPFMSRRYKIGFDSDIIELIVKRLLHWDEAIPELVKSLYRLNNIRIMARDMRTLAAEFERKIPDDTGIELSIYDRDAVIRLLVSALYRS
jgi:hypothetical protein